jgi:hypothetical protein
VGSQTPTLRPGSSVSCVICTYCLPINICLQPLAEAPFRPPVKMESLNREDIERCAVHDSITAHNRAFVGDAARVGLGQARLHVIGTCINLDAG